MRGTPDSRTRGAIADRMWALLNAEERTQVALCRRAGISTTAFSNWLNGSRPGLDQAIKLCDAFDLTLDWIYFGDDRGVPHEVVEAYRRIKAGEIARRTAKAAGRR